jgi:AAA+ ATPase superfamily predicted ATPase
MKKASKFIGREKELNILEDLSTYRNASLVVIRGRRRVGKSALVKEFSKDKIFLSFSGLPPTVGMTAQDQRDNFVDQLCSQTRIVKPDSANWFNLFLALAQEITTKKTVILLDEISWMADKDPTFLPKLKSAWDDFFSQKSQLILILCGSVSSWIEKNILSSTGFFGRITSQITLEELSLTESVELLANQNFTGGLFEKMMLLSITGGVPWYIELLGKGGSCSTQVMQVCFSKDGVLVSEFDRIFHDLFGRRSDVYQKMLEVLMKGPLTHRMLAEKIEYQSSGALTDYLDDLVLSGFLAEEVSWSLETGLPGQFKTYSLRDYYLRFYFKCIQPNLTRIQKRLFEAVPLSSLKNFSGLMGLQFENLMIQNRDLIYQALGISRQDIIFDGPYIQRATSRKIGCQIDYLIQTRLGVFYVCEIKFTTKTLGVSVIEEVKEKIKALKNPKNTSLVPVLIYLGERSEDLENSDYFIREINAAQWFG